MADSNWSVRIGTRVTDDIQKQLDTMPKKTVTVKAVLDNTGLKTIGTTELTKYEDALGNVVVANKKFDASGKELNNTIKSVKSTVDTTSQTLQTASKHTKTLGQDFVETAGKVTKFYVITKVIQTVRSAISEAVKSVKELDSAMVEFNKVSSLSGSGLDNYTKKLGELGLEVARTKEEMVEASTEFVKAGYTEEESAKLAKTASLLQNVADAELSASEASTVLISNMKAFGMTSADSERVVDVINEVSNVFAVSSSDISAGLSKTASAMSTLGNTYEQSIALMVGAGEQMPNQSGKIARGLRSIGLEIVKTAKQTKELDTGYRDVTLSLYDQNGALKSTFDIMSELYPTWKKMTNEQKSNLGISLAGKQQYEVFSATMEGFDQVLKANEVGLNAMGSAMKENEAYMDGIEAKTKLLKAQFDLLVNGDGGLNSFIKGILDVSTAILKITSDLGGLPVVLMAILSVTTLLKGQMITVGLIKLANFIPTLVTSLKGLQIMYNSATKSIILSNQAINLSIPVIGLVVTAITALTMAWNGLESAQEEAERATKESISSILSEIESLEQISKQLEDETLTREALYALIKGTDAYSSEMEDLEDVNELRQTAIDKIKEEQRLKAQQLVDTGLTSYQQALYRQTQEGSDFSYTPYSPVHMQASVDAINNASGTQEKIEATSNYKNAVIELRGEHKEGTFDYKQYTKTISRAEAELSNLYATQQEDNALTSDFNNSLSILGQKYDEVTKMVVDLTQEEIDNISKTKESTEAQEEQNRATSEAIKRKKESADAYKELIDGFSDIQSSYDTLSTAMNEYNENGTYSLDTVSKLLSLDSEYLSMLQLVNGQMTLNEEAIRNKVIAQAEETKQEIYSTAIAELNAIATGKSSEATDTLATKKSNSSIDIAKQTTSLSENNYQLAINNALQAQGQESQDAVNDVIKRTTDSINAINTAVSGMGVNFEGSMGKASKATKAQTKAIAKQREALNKLKDEYKAVTKYIEDQLDSEISRIKDAKSAELDRVDAIIDALNKRKDAELESINSTIDTLNKRKDAELESIDSTIDALNKKRDAEEEYWDNRISALKEQNDATEKQIALEQLQQNLALARNKKVMVMGANGWEVRSDESAISQAEQEIANYNRKQQAQTEIDILNKLKTEAISSYDSQIQAQKEFKSQQKSNYDSQIQAQEEFRDRQKSTYDSQIQAQEEFRDRQEATYDSQIQVIEGYKTEYNNMVDAYEKDQNRLIALQVLGTDFENQTWQARLANLQSYVNRYNSLQASLSSSVANTSSESVETVKKTPVKETPVKKTPVKETPVKKTPVKKTPSAGGGGSTGGGGGHQSSSGASHGGSGPRRYASGVASVSSNEIAMIGDNPSNRELVIGSKLNGTATMLSQGSGVVNAQSTKSLAGILNTLGSSMGLNGQTMGMNTTNQSNATSQSIQIANITLPSVTNGQGLLDELRGFASGMLQTSYSNG